MWPRHIVPWRLPLQHLLLTYKSVDGVVIVDKPREWTSHDVVNKMRRFAGTREVGHLGTLDPRPRVSCRW